MYVENNNAYHPIILILCLALTYSIYSHYNTGKDFTMVCKTVVDIHDPDRLSQINPSRSKYGKMLSICSDRVSADTYNDMPY